VISRSIPGKRLAGNAGTMAVIEVEHLHKRYRDHVAVDDVSFTVERGEIFGVLGPNGAGKTTTVECVEGLRTPDGGAVRVLGLDPRRDHDTLRTRIGVQFQESQLPEKMRVREALRLYSSFYADPMDWRALLDDWGLADKANTPFGKLSGGQKQRLFIALALVGKPEIAVLDELTTGLDPQARRDTWGLVEDIRGRGVTVLLVTHFMAEAERLCDRIAVIDRGRVVALDTPAGLVSKVAAEQRIRFRPSVPVPDGLPIEDLLADLPEVTSMRHVGPQLEITGTGDLLQAVTSVLARHRVVAADLRVEQASLDDAFVALTGRMPEEVR
jgi:ABC-2 type transport system ATP-binding protein